MVRVIRVEITHRNSSQPIPANIDKPHPDCALAKGVTASIFNRYVLPQTENNRLNITVREIQQNEILYHEVSPRSFFRDIFIERISLSETD
jgi:hypothetical protein